MDLTNAIIKHNSDDALGASSTLSDKLVSYPQIEVERINPTAFICMYTDDDGQKQCKMIVTNDNHHFINNFQYPEDQENPSTVDLTKEDECEVCPTCGKPIDTNDTSETSQAVDDVNDPNTPDDIEIVAVVTPADIYGHIADAELNESVEHDKSNKVMVNTQELTHEFVTPEGASKHIENAMVKKYKGKVNRHSPVLFSHLREDGTCDKVLSEASKYVITSCKM